MKINILFLFLFPILVNAQIGLSGSNFFVNNGSCNGASISVNGNYLLDGKVNSRYQFSQILNLQAPNYQLCFNNTLYSVPSNKLNMRWSGTQWQLGFVGTANNQTNFIEISSIPIGSIYSMNHTPDCDAPVFGGVLKGMPTITGSNCVGSTLTASAFGATAFQWYKDSKAILGATDATYIPSEAGNYQVSTTFEEGYWIPTSSSPSNQQLIDVFFIDSTTGWVLGSGGQIFKTSLAGDIWTPQSSGVTTTLNAIHFTDSNNGVAVGANGVIIRTTNGGTSWQSVQSGVSNNLADVFFLNANTGWAVGSQYVVLKTIDGGNTWSKVSIDNGASTSDSYNDVQFTDINTGYVAGSSSTNSTSFVRKSINGGINWTTSTSSSAGIIRKLSFIDNNTGWTGGRNSNPSTTFPEVSKTANGGTNWLSYSDIQSTTYVNTSIGSLQFIDANRGWMLSSSNTNSIIITTINGGNTFFAGSIYFNQQSQYIGSRIFMLPSGNSGWIIGRDSDTNRDILRYSNTICSSNVVTVSSQNLVLSGTATSNLESGCSIVSTQLVPEGISSTYSAKNRVSLLPPFQANNGSVISVNIEDTKANLLKKNAYIIDTVTIVSQLNNNITISRISENNGYNVGDIILAPPCTKAPYGFLRKITSRAVSGDIISCQTEQATLSEAFEQLNIDETIDGNFDIIKQGRKNISDGGSLTYNFFNNTTLFPGVTINGTANANISRIKFKYQLMKGSLLPSYVLLKADFNTARSEINISSSDVVVSPEVTYADYILPDFYIEIPIPTPIGKIGFPIRCVQKFSLKGGPIIINGKAKWNILPSINGVIGMEFINGNWKNLSTFSVDPKATALVKGDFNPDLSMDASFTLIKPTYEFSPYGADVVKFYAEAPCQITYTGQLPSPQYSLKFNLSVKAGLTSKFWDSKNPELAISASLPEKTILEGNWDNYKLEYISGNGQSYWGGGMPFPMVFKIKNISTNTYVTNINLSGLSLSASANVGFQDVPFTNRGNYCGTNSTQCFGAYYYVPDNRGRPAFTLNITVTLKQNGRILDSYNIQQNILNPL